MKLKDIFKDINKKYFMFTVLAKPSASHRIRQTAATSMRIILRLIPKEQIHNNLHIANFKGRRFPPTFTFRLQSKFNPFIPSND